MFDIQQTDDFRKWLKKLKDRKARNILLERINRMKFAHWGDVKPVGEGVREFRVHYGPGFRVYFIQMGETVIVLLCGGTKGSQDKDIQKAKQLARILKE
tara:strand:+ start:196 stop:492 length:297 start_codon:yes stop_codon:yes gene_type:complete